MKYTSAVECAWGLLSSALLGHDNEAGKYFHGCHPKLNHSHHCSHWTLKDKWAIPRKMIRKLCSLEFTTYRLDMRGYRKSNPLDIPLQQLSDLFAHFIFLFWKI